MKRFLSRLARRNRYRRVTQPVRLPEAAGGLSIGLFLAVPIIFAVLVLASVLTNRSLSPMSWYLARATGITLYVLFWAVVTLGLLLTTHSVGRIVSKATLLSLHSYSSQLAYAFLAGHLLSLVVDRHLPFDVVHLISPFSGPSAEPWTGFGVLAMYMFIVVIASVSLRRYIPYPVWRFLHILAFPMYALSLLHGIGIGSSRSALPMQMLYLLTTAVVVYLSLSRLFIWRPKPDIGEVRVANKPFDRLGGQTRIPPAMHRRLR